MTDYTELVKALRYCTNEDNVCTQEKNCGYYGKGFFCQDSLMNDAAAAIEALQEYLAASNDEVNHLAESNKELQAELKELCDKKREFKRACGLIVDEPMQMPKRGEWVPYEFNTNGTWHKCSVCGVAYKYKDAPNSGWWINHKYCPNCGAKMEVQDADT